MMADALFRVDACDNVATALRDIVAGELGLGILVAEPIPKGHKIALRSIGRGEQVMKYGFPIGRATADIAPGEHVHSHNIATGLLTSAEYAYQRRDADIALAGMTGATGSFQGYLRPDGRVGTRNEIWVIPTVGCVARTAEKIAKAAASLYAGEVDGVHAIVHPFGCSQLGSDLDDTRAILASLASHPNAGGVLVVGLGCESNQLDSFLAEVDQPNVRGFVAQLVADEVDEGIALVGDLVAAARSERVPVPLSRLVVGVKCGGSDGFSGLTANPLVGGISDAITGAGGAVLVTEIPEIFGAEQLLMARAADEAVFAKIGALVNDFKAYFTRHGEPVSENPSPGNIAGGITTLEEKSLGAVQKAGHATVTDVIPYGARLRHAGLTLLEAPGNDAVSSTALAAAGATVILFTTGRGTPLGFPVPTIKIASNTDLARRKPHWIDFDAGRVLTSGADSAQADFLATITRIASGAPTAAERNGEREIGIWKRGVTL